MQMRRQPQRRVGSWTGVHKASIGAAEAPPPCTPHVPFRPATKGHTSSQTHCAIPSEPNCGQIFPGAIHCPLTGHLLALSVPLGPLLVSGLLWRESPFFIREMSKARGRPTSHLPQKTRHPGPSSHPERSICRGKFTSKSWTLA